MQCKTNAVTRVIRLAHSAAWLVGASNCVWLSFADVALFRKPFSSMGYALQQYPLTGTLPRECFTGLK